MNLADLQLRHPHSRMGYEGGGEWCTGCSWQGDDWSEHRKDLLSEFFRRNNLQSTAEEARIER